jgi:tryptophanase
MSEDENLPLKLMAEPYRIKMVEKIKLPNRAEREAILKKASYAIVNIDAQDVYIDLATDSGTGAMSDEQWAGLIRGDESYIRARSFFELQKSVTEVFGPRFKHVVPTHQGRAAEHILMELLVKEDDIILSNTLFDTTRAHVERRRGRPVDLVGDELWSFSEAHPFKGNFDLARLEVALERYHKQVPFVLITVVNNLACSSPVSMANIREVKRLADRWNKPVYFDACRFAENAYFIKTREPGYQDKSIGEIVHEMLSHGQGCWMSAKKDAIVNIGGFLALENEVLARRCQELVVLYEGFMTYGGLAGRDLEAMAQGLREGIEEPYLAHRTGQVAYLAERFEQAGVTVSKPAGGSGVFADVSSIYGHLPPEKLPGVAMAADLYLEGAVRAGAIPFHLRSVDPKTGEFFERDFMLARFALPRRLYTKGHLDYVGEVMARVKKNASRSKGYERVKDPVEVPSVLDHFFAKYRPIT